MGTIKAAYIFPHPPIIVPEVGRGNEQKAIGTIEAVKRASKDIKNNVPSTIIITSPHAPMFRDYIYISDADKLIGGLEKFGSSSVNLSFKNNTKLVNNIIRYARGEGIACGGLDEKTRKRFDVSEELDHGAVIPLYFIKREYSSFQIVHISSSMLPRDELYRFGNCIDKAVKDSEEEIVFIASGDLSHRLSHDAPYGFSPHGSEFDNLLIKSLTAFDTETLINIDDELCESAAQCGLNSFVIMLGALDRYDYEPEIYSYEGPFGVGYAVAGFKIKKDKEGGEILNKIKKI